MNLEMKELLSLLIDDALPLEKKGKVLKILKEDRALQKTWHIYHMIRHSLRNQKVNQFKCFDEAVIHSAKQNDKQKYH